MKPCTLLSHFFKSFANLDPFRKLFCPDQDQDLTFEFNTMQSCILCIRVTHQISFRFESSFKSYCDHGQTDRPTEIKKCIFQVSERKKRELKEELLSSPSSSFSSSPSPPSSSSSSFLQLTSLTSLSEIRENYLIKDLVKFFFIYTGFFLFFPDRTSQSREQREAKKICIKNVRGTSWRDKNV